MIDLIRRLDLHVGRAVCRFAGHAWIRVPATDYDAACRRCGETR